MELNSKKLSLISMAVGLVLLPLKGFSAEAVVAGSPQTRDITEEKTNNNSEKESPNGEPLMVVTARVQTLQAPGVSTINAEEIKKQPPERDVSELIRTMPGVNLTGNSTSGQRGNNRQIDIRGMGPENTLILIDGMPVSSKNSVRYGWRGERDSRGDTAWVPPEMIERIEVLRGPAAALYGSGAAGGVVNIITRPATDELHGSFNSYYNVPEHKNEGASRRFNGSLTGALLDNLTFKLYGGWAKTQADAMYINKGHEALRTGIYAGSIPAGREGVKNEDINGALRWEFMPGQALELGAGFSRQGNLYAGDTQNTNTNALVQAYYGKETNTLYRQNLSLKQTGVWDNGVSTTHYIQYEHTRNTRLNEGLAGGTEGIFNIADPGFSTIDLTNTSAHSEVNVPLELWVPQTLTLGAEWNHQQMKDPISNTQSTASGGTVAGIDPNGRSVYTSSTLYSLFADDNIELTETTVLTPGIRFNHHLVTGNNFSPSLNLSQALGSDFTLKMGIARAYKAPNLYQTNPNYLLYSNGQGCYASAGACYLQGNDDLKAETSINKEIGLEFHRDDYQAGLTYFHNDYRNKIEAGYAAEYSTTKADVYKWDNVPRALIQGLEGTLNFPITSDIAMKNNFTYIIENKNKKTGDYLSIIPEFTVNSTLEWQARSDLSVRGTVAWYGVQKPKKYNYKGIPATGSETTEVSPYAQFGLSTTYSVNKYVDVTAGIDNLLDKRHYRAGNASTTGNAATGAFLYGAGAETYNDSGRTYFMSLNTHF